MLTTHHQIHKPGRLLEQVGMPAHALEGDLGVVQLVDEQPIRFDMAFASVLEIALQGMVTIAFCQRFFVDQRRQDLFELLDVFAAALLQALDAP